jgi:hypothetical protein
VGIMGRYSKYNTPLTEQQKVFATEHHKLIYRFMHSKKLDSREWYDVVAIGYMKAVLLWFQRKDLHKYAFSTICYYKMLNAVGNERAKKRIKTISLQQAINETDNITYGDIVTDKNLLYVQYIGVDEMEIHYNVNLPKKTHFRTEEGIAIDEFLSSENKNMCFQYDSVEEAKKKKRSLNAFKNKRKERQKLYEVYRVDNCVYVNKTAFYYEMKQKRKQANEA